MVNSTKETVKAVNEFMNYKERWTVRKVFIMLTSLKLKVNFSYLIHYVRR